MIEVVNRHTWKPDGRANVYVGRGNPLGNPEHLKNEADRDANLARYERWLRTMWTASAAVRTELLRLFFCLRRSLRFAIRALDSVQGLEEVTLVFVDILRDG